MREKPLSGHTVVLTRSREQNVLLSEKLRARGADVVLLPTIRYSDVAPSSEIREAIKPAGYSHVLFTSQNAVRFFCARSDRLGLPADRWQSCCVATVGPKTARAASEHGLRPDFVAHDARGESLVRELVAAGQLDSNSRVLLPQSSLARPETIAALRDAGAEVTPLVVYETATESPEAAQEFLAAVQSETAPDSILFASPSAVTGFLELTREAGRKFLEDSRVRVITIGPTTTSAIEQKGFEIDAVATEPSADGLVAACERALG